MNKIIFAVVGVVLIIGIGWFLMGDKSSDSNIEASVSAEAVVSNVMNAQESPSASVVPSVAVSTAVSPAISVAPSTTKEFVVSASDFTFDLKEIKVKKGDKVRIVLKNTVGFHDWKVDEFNASTKKISGGQEDSVEFIADKTGTFEYYCSVGSHRAKGMKGNLIVTE